MIRPLTTADLSGAAELLAARHRAQRLVEPGLAPAFEDDGAAGAAIAGLLDKPRASGVVASRDGSLVGYLVGAPREGAWGPNMWVEGAGHAVVEPELIRDLYGAAAAGWVREGLTSHYAVVPATDAALVDAWFRVGFGQQHVHAIREAPSPDAIPSAPAGLVIRRAQRRDIPALSRLALVLPKHQAESPVFSLQPPPTIDEVTGELADEFDDPTYTTFVASVRGEVVGSAVGCAIEVSTEHHGVVRPLNAGFLGYAAVLPEGRGLGAGRALAEAVMCWARDAGHPTVVIDWRETNLLASRTWPRLGFRPTFRRLHRVID